MSFLGSALKTVVGTTAKTALKVGGIASVAVVGTSIASEVDEGFSDSIMDLASDAIEASIFDGAADLVGDAISGLFDLF